MRVMPAGSWLTSASASVSGDPGVAESPTAPAGAAAPAGGSPSAALTGCTPKHSDVARMMVRLRQLHRVVDVELTQSSLAEPDAESAAIDACGPNTSFDLTLTFGPSAAVAAAPRGPTRVPASLGGGS